MFQVQRFNSFPTLNLELWISVLAPARRPKALGPQGGGLAPRLLSRVNNSGYVSCRRRLLFYFS